MNTQKRLKAIEEWLNQNRPISLVTMSLLSIGLFCFIDWLFGSPVFKRIFYPSFDEIGSARAWSAISYNSILVMGLPSAFLLWLWRDQNVRDQLAEKKNEVENQRSELEVLKLQVSNQGNQVRNQTREIELQNDQLEVQREQIANQRKDISLREFQEVQKVAAGLFDTVGSDSAKIQLQIAAMHQLRGFLKDEYPETFRRAAFELLLAGHTEAIVSGTEDRDLPAMSHWSLTSLFNTFDTITLERAKILRDESEKLLQLGFPLQGRRFDFLGLSKVNLHNTTLSGSSFVGAILREANMESSWFTNANFSGANIRQTNFRSANSYHAKFHKVIGTEADFSDADLSWCDFLGATLRKANFTGADCRYAEFKDANLREANLASADFRNVDMRGAHLFDLTLDEQTMFTNSTFDDSTKFADGWAKLSESAKADYRSRWRDRGMKHVNDVQSEEELDDDIPF